MNKINAKQAGLAFAVFFGLLHLLWVIGIFAGLGQKVADLWHSVHFLTDIHVIGSFSLKIAVLGFLGAAASGYLAGVIFALIWNWSGKKCK